MSDSSNVVSKGVSETTRLQNIEAGFEQGGSVEDVVQHLEEADRVESLVAKKAGGHHRAYDVVADFGGREVDGGTAGLDTLHIAIALRASLH